MTSLGAGYGVGGYARPERFFYIILYKEVASCFKRVAQDISHESDIAYERVLKDHLRDTQAPGGTYFVYNTSTGEGIVLEAVRNDYEIKRVEM